MSKAEEIEAARARFKSFHRREPRDGEIAAIPMPAGSVVVLEVGALVGLAYEASGDGKRYFHEFEGKRPRVFVTADGAQAFLTGGAYTFTDRGFIG